MKPYRRSKLSLLVQETAQYTADMERITVLRNKSFQFIDNHELQKEWEDYNRIIAVMQQVLIMLSETVLKERKAKHEAN